jgi:AcrR family transcriptional regulator
MERLTAEERRAVVLEAAMTVFGARGFLGTPTIDVAEAVGISHAYLFRLFPKKVDLALPSCSAPTSASTTRSPGSRPRRAPNGAIPARLGEAYAELLQDRRLLLTQTFSVGESVWSGGGVRRGR